MKTIKKVKLHNFKRFTNFEVSLDDKLNVFVGENETGKSSILSAINLVLSGSRSQVDKVGLEGLLNARAVETFMASDRSFAALPTLYVEIWLDEQNNFELNGNNNSENVVCDGLRLECSPILELSNEITAILANRNSGFPFEYYSAKFTTFQGDAYAGYKKYLTHIVLDTTLISSEHAMREYIGNIYEAHVTGSERNKHESDYRQAKDSFKRDSLQALNARITDYSFSVRHNTKSNLRTDLTLVQDSVDIDNKGRGRQCFIKTEFALRQAGEGVKKIDVALIEEPENHLSHVNMKKLIRMINASDDKQLIIATHSNLISSRLDLKKAILLHKNSETPVLLSMLSTETSEFFMKAPDHGILNFVLSNKVMLVEGDAEYILMEKLYRTVTGRELADNDLHILSVDGTSFKRYLDLARLLGIKVAVVRDNDMDFQANCVERYSGYTADNINVFFDNDNARNTFEICLYQDNQQLCDTLFGQARRTLSVQEYMIKNKTEAALKLLKAEAPLTVPTYIRQAIEWLNN